MNKKDFAALVPYVHHFWWNNLEIIAGSRSGKQRTRHILILACCFIQYNRLRNDYTVHWGGQTDGRANGRTSALFSSHFLDYMEQHRAEEKANNSLRFSAEKVQ